MLFAVHVIPPAAVRVHMPPAEGPAGIGPAAAGGGAVGGPAPPPVYMSAPEDATPKQGCIDACLGRCQCRCKGKRLHAAAGRRGACRWPTCASPRGNQHRQAARCATVESARDSTCPRRSAAMRAASESNAPSAHTRPPLISSGSTCSALLCFALAASAAPQPQSPPKPPIPV